jgi:hypothetical protein
MTVEQVFEYTLFVALDKETYDAVAGFHRYPWFDVSPPSVMNYGTKEYYGLMHKRTKLVLALIEHSIPVFIGEVDQVWFVDPIRYVETRFQGI